MTEIVAKPEISDDIEYLQTVRDGKTEENVTTAMLIDPPRKRPNIFSESEDDILLSSDQSDGEYQLSSSSSSENDTITDRNVTVDQKHTSQSNGTTPADYSIVSKGKSPTSKHQTTSRTYQDLLTEISKEKLQIPTESNLGPKPWLMKQKRASKKYEVSDLLFEYKPKKEEQKEDIVKPRPERRTQIENDVRDNIEDPESLYDTPRLRGRMSSASSGNAISDNDRSSKHPSETDTGFASNTSSNPSPSNSLSRTPSSEEKKSITGSKQNAQELARAALQALSVSKNILQGMEKAKDSSDPDSIYDEVPVSPVTSPMTNIPKSGNNVYDDVPLHDDVIKDKNDVKRTVISVPIFKPPDNPIRSNRNHAMSSDPLYDITRSDTRTPQNLSSDALDLMYQLFGKDLAGKRNETFNKAGYDIPNHGRPSSVKSVKFEDEIGSQFLEEGFPSRPSSRAGSVYSEWSDCTINVPDYPESEASTMPRTQIEFPRFPQVGFPPPPTNQPPTFTQNNPTFPTPTNAPFPNGPPLQFSNDPPVFQPPFIRGPNLYQTPNAAFGPRNPLFATPTPRPPAAPMYPLFNTNYMPHEIPNAGNPNFPPNNPYRPVESQMGQFARAPSHAFSPPRQWGGFSPPREFHPRHHHHAPHHQHEERRGRSRGNHAGRKGWPRSHSRSRRHNYPSEDEESSRSLSPVRHRDVIHAEVIAGKSYIDGYKAALKDAVKTFAEKQSMKRIAAAPFDDSITREERMQKALRRTLSAGRIRELPDNIELGDIRRAFEASDRSLSDDEFDREIDFTVPSAGRPRSKSRSMRSRGSRRQRYPSDDDVIDDRRYRDQMTSDSDHVESCDCSECEEEFEMMSRRRRDYGGMEMTSRTNGRNDMQDAPRRENYDLNSSPRMKGLRQRFLDTFEETSSVSRAPVRANHDRYPQYDDQGYDDVRFRQAEERRRINYEDVRLNAQNNARGFRNDGYGRQRSPGNGNTQHYQGQRRGFRNEPNHWQQGRR